MVIITPDLDAIVDAVRHTYAVRGLIPASMLIMANMKAIIIANQHDERFISTLSIITLLSVCSIIVVLEIFPRTMKNTLDKLTRFCLNLLFITSPLIAYYQNVGLVNCYDGGSSIWNQGLCFWRLLNVKSDLVWWFGVVALGWGVYYLSCLVLPALYVVAIAAATFVTFQMMGAQA